MDSASKDLVDEQVYSWLETHKKSGLSYAVLRLLKHKPMWSKDLTEQLTAVTGWQISERALYRLLRRMQKQGLVSHITEAAPRTGADRKVYRLTTEGELFSESIKDELNYLAKLDS
ncbi:MAG: PadR family transcriptional regulator [Patescibacteria group bacterium]